MKDFCKHEGKKVLLVEGKDDCHVILALCAHFNIPGTFGIYECGSDISLLKRLNALILQPAKAKGLTTYKPDHHSKAVIHTWLSWQDEPGKPLGQAITANLLKPETDLAQVFINWLKKLFGS